MSLIGLSGKIRSGKSEVASMIRSTLLPKRFKTKKFAFTLKAMTATLLDCSLEDLESQEFKEVPISWLDGITPRLILQKLGTEFGRDMIHTDIWVRALLKDYTEDENWIVDDVRFPNEAKAVREKGGVLIRISRRTGAVNEHPSETSLDDYTDWDYIIDNCYDLNYLRDQVKEICKEL